MPFEWLSLAANGVALLTTGPTMHSWISGFSLAKRVNTLSSEIEMLSGKIVQVSGTIDRIADHHFGTNTLGVSMPGGSIVNLSKNRRLKRPALIETDYVTECETEIENSFSQAFLDSPENFLHGICKISEQPPEIALLKDDTLVPWHFSDGEAHKIGFTKKGFLDHLGIRYLPLGNFDPSLVDSDVPPVELNEPNMFPAAKENREVAMSKDRNVPSSMARIRKYRGQEGFSGIHEYYVACAHCSAELDFPTGIYTERYLKLRCPVCERVFLGEVLRSNLSLRFFKDWQQKNP